MDCSEMYYALNRKDCVQYPKNKSYFVNLINWYDLQDITPCNSSETKSPQFSELFYYTSKTSYLQILK